MRTLSRIGLVALGAALAGGGFWAGSRQVRPSTTPSPSPAGRRQPLFYRSPMDPTVHSKTPMKDDMGMDYIPVYSEDAGPEPVGVAGRGVVTVPEERRRVLGIRTAEVRRGPLVRTLRTVGRVVVDERRVHHVHTKYDGYVEHVHVDVTGTFVRKGEPLLSIYSPDLVATQQEYLMAYRAARQMADGGASLREGGRGLLAAARQRLELWDIPSVDIEALETSGRVMRALDLYSDVSGYVVEKNVTHGMRVTASDSLFLIADLSHLWVLADVYEADLPSIRLGTRAEVRVTYLGGRTWTGPVTFISPTVEEKTRTVKVRVEVDNADNDLKPDMFTDVFLKTDMGTGLLAPADAILDAGDRKLAFVDRGEGRLEPREVGTGFRVGDDVQVLSGLAAGDHVVTGANFLVDSESSLRAALRGFQSPAAGER